MKRNSILKSQFFQIERIKTKFLQEIKTIPQPSAPVKSTAKIPLALMSEGKEEFNPTFESKRNQALLCKFLHGRACPAALPKSVTAPFKEGLGFELFGRKGRKPK